MGVERPKVEKKLTHCLVKWKETNIQSNVEPEFIQNPENLGVD